MTIPEINQLRKSGNVEDAYRECKALLNQSPDDRGTRICMAWCLKSLSEIASKNKEYDRFIDLLKELANLQLEEVGENSMANRFAWDLHVLFDSMKFEPEKLVGIADRIVEILPKLCFLKPNKYYSMLADSFLKVKGRQGAVWLRFYDFMNWFGFDNFSDEDYKKIQIKDGKSIISLVERVYSAYYKVLNALFISGAVDAEKIKNHLDKLDELNEKHPEYQYTLYHKALLLLMIDKKEDAIQAIRPFVKKKRNDFWVWDVLGDAIDDDELKLSCYCRALSCKAEPKFLGKVRIKTAKVMHTLGFDGNARTEIRLLHKVYEENGWNTPKEALEIKKQQWYQAATASDSNLDFYKSHLGESEEFLFIDTPEMPILITRVNKEKHICNFVDSERNRGFFSTKKLKGKFFENNVILARVEKENDCKISRLLTWRKVDNLLPYEGVFFKTIDGYIKIKEGKNFGFVGDIFVDESLLKDNVVAGEYVSVKAVITYNQKKDSWGWRAIALRTT